ncbi:MAG: hypothetical protein ACREJC_22170, partial [Tepidisphaeraceae bacterium]
MRNATNRAARGLLAAACALVTCGSTSHAVLTIDVIATSATGTSTITDGGKQVLNSSAGDLIHFDFYADLPNVDGDPSNDGVQIVVGSFLSSNLPVGGGFLRGDLSPVLLDPRFSNSGSSPGVQSDLDGDGDLDLGSNNNSSATNFFAARGFGIPEIGTHLHLGSLELQIASVNFILGVQTEVNFRKRQSTFAFLFTQDGVVFTITSGALENTTVGLPVVFFVPEPCAVAVMMSAFCARVLRPRIRA